MSPSTDGQIGLAWWPDEVPENGWSGGTGWPIRSSTASLVRLRFSRRVRRSSIWAIFLRAVTLAASSASPGRPAVRASRLASEDISLEVEMASN